MADYYPFISRAVGALDINNKEARRALYEHARVALADKLLGVDPPLSETEFEHERMDLENAIGKVEAGAQYSARRNGQRPTVYKFKIMIVRL
jgi:hypothetical protein